MSEWSGLGQDIREIRKQTRESNKYPSSAEKQAARDRSVVEALGKVHKKREVAKWKKRSAKAIFATGAVLSATGIGGGIGVPLMMWGAAREIRGTHMNRSAARAERKVTRAATRGR